MRGSTATVHVFSPFLWLDCLPQLGLRKPPHVEVLNFLGWAMKRTPNVTGRHDEGLLAQYVDREEKPFCALRHGTGRKQAMNNVLWVLQVLAALVYSASGVMKVFMFDKVSVDVPSFGALPREAWTALGILELVCVVGLIGPGAFRWKPAFTVVAAAILAIESLVFIAVHVKYREIAPIIISGVLGLLMAFIAYGRMVLRPIS